MRRAIFSLFLVLALFVGANVPAQAATGVVVDAVEGQYPDILKLRVDNGADTLTLKVFYTAMPDGEFGGEEVHFGRSPDFAHYAVSTNWNYMTEKWVTRLVRVAQDTSFHELSCPGLKRFRDYAAETSRYSVPRTCFPNAADSIRFWGITCTAGCDEFGPSRLFARG